MLFKDSSGNLIPNTAPAIKEENAETNQVTLTWIFEIGVDKKIYRETLLTIVKKCLDAITGHTAKSTKMALEKSDTKRDFAWFQFDLPERLSKKEFYYISAQWPEAESVKAPTPIRLIHSISKNFDYCNFFWYPHTNNILKMLYKSDDGQLIQQGCFLSLELIDIDNEVIGFAKEPCWQPFQCEYGTFKALGYNIRGGDENIRPNHLMAVEVTLPISDAKSIKSVKVSLDVKEPAFCLEAVKD
jgi:hypothetical protein